MENLRIRDFLPLKMSAVQRIFHQDLCKSYSKISKTHWVPKQGDYFYRIARNIIGLYKRNNRQRGLLLKHDYLNKVVHPNKQFQEGGKPSQEGQASIKNHRQDNDNSNSKINGDLSKSDPKGGSNDGGNGELPRRPKRTQALKPNDILNLGVHTTKTPCLAAEKEKPERKRKNRGGLNRTQCISCRRYFDCIEVHLMGNKYCNETYNIVVKMKRGRKDFRERQELRSRCMSCKKLFLNVEDHLYKNKMCKCYYNKLESGKMAKCKRFTVDVVKIKLKKCILDELKVERKKRPTGYGTADYWRLKHLNRLEQCTSESHKKINDLLIKSLNFEDDDSPLCNICNKIYIKNPEPEETPSHNRHIFVPPGRYENQTFVHPASSVSQSFVPAHHIFGNPMLQVKQEIVETTPIIARTSTIKTTPIIARTSTIKTTPIILIARTSTIKTTPITHVKQEETLLIEVKQESNPVIDVKQEVEEESIPVMDVKQEVFDSSYEHENEEDYAYNPLVNDFVKVEEMSVNEDFTAGDSTVEERVDVLMNASADSDHLVEKMNDHKDYTSLDNAQVESFGVLINSSENSDKNEEEYDQNPLSYEGIDANEDYSACDNTEKSVDVLMNNSASSEDLVIKMNDIDDYSAHDNAEESVDVLMNVSAGSDDLTLLIKHE